MRGTDRAESQRLFSKGGSVNYKGAVVPNAGGNIKGDVWGMFFTERVSVPGMRCQRRWWNQEH